MLFLWLLACAPDDAPAPVDSLAPPPDWVEPDQAGPYAAGTTTRTFTDHRGHDLTVEVWYPAVDPGTDPEPYEEVPITGSAHRDAEADQRGAPYPLVAFSHGFGGIRYQSTFLTDHLAQHGFVVVGMDHPHNSMLDLDVDLTAQVMLDRPTDVIVSVDQVLTLNADDPLLSGLVQGDEYAMIGHSFGAFTALLLGGGETDLAYGATFCETSSNLGCNFFDGLDLDLAAVPESDPRAVLIVPMAPGGWYAFGENGVGLSTTVPSLVFAGDEDGELPYESEGAPVISAMGSPSIGVTVHGGGHWGFSDLCALIPVEDCAGEAGGFIDPLLSQQISKTLVTAAIGEALTGNPDYLPWLQPDAWGPEITLETR